MLSRRRERKGFTLIELMIVVAIIGILAAIAIPQFAKMREKGYDADAQSALANIKTAQEAYFIDNDAYAATVGELSEWYAPVEADYAQIGIELGNSANGGQDNAYVVTVQHKNSKTQFEYDSETGKVTSSKAGGDDDDS